MTSAQGNSSLFKAAHQMTKSIIKAGDSYSVTFGLCYKAVMAQEKAKPSIPVVEAAIGYFAGFTISAKSGALVMIEAFKLASAFGVASLILYAVYSFIGWGEAGDYQAVELV